MNFRGNPFPPPPQVSGIRKRKRRKSEKPRRLALWGESKTRTKSLTLDDVVRLGGFLLLKWSGAENPPTNPWGFSDLKNDFCAFGVWKWGVYPTILRKNTLNWPRWAWYWLPETNVASKVASENRQFAPKGNEIVWTKHPFSGADLLLVSGRRTSPDFHQTRIWPGCDKFPVNQNKKCPSCDYSHLMLRTTNYTCFFWLWCPW